MNPSIYNTFVCQDNDVEFSDIFDRMFEQEQNDMECSDVEFKFSDGTILYAHRIILFSRCDFYRTMMTGSWKESQPPHKVEEESDPRIFKEFIRYLYCGKVYINAVEDLMLLYSIAEAKCHSSLLVWLSRTIQEHTTAGNGCKLLQMLWDTCDRTTQCFRDTFNFIKDKILENIDSFKENRVCELEQEVLTEVLKHQKHKDQKEIFEAVIVWVNNCTSLPEDCEKRRYELRSIMSTIDFKSMRTWYFYDKVVPLNVLDHSVLNNIIFRFNVDTIGTSIEEISDAKWRCVIPYDEPTIHLKFKYNLRSFNFKFLQRPRCHLALFLKNDCSNERIKTNYTLLHTSTDDKLKLSNTCDAIYNSTDDSWGKEKIFDKTLEDMKKEGYVFNKHLVIEFEMNIEEVDDK
ncbi:Btbd9, partial [Acrasis kona]